MTTQQNEQDIFDTLKAAWDAATVRSESGTIYYVSAEPQPVGENKWRTSSEKPRLAIAAFKNRHLIPIDQSAE